MENESRGTPQTPDGRNGAALSDGMRPPHRALAQRDFLAQFGAALTERAATASPPVYRGPTDAPWAPLRLLKRKPLGAQGLIAQAGACAIRGLRPGRRSGHLEPATGRKRRRGLGLVAEMATGKTLLSLAMLGLADEDVTRERATDDQRPEKHSFFPAVVLCPPIVVEKWAREARETLPTARPVVIRALRTRAEVTAFRQFDPTFTGTRLSAMGCADRVVARMRAELRVWREQRDKALREGHTPPRKPCHLAILSTSTAKLGPAWTPVYLLRTLREVGDDGKVRLLRDPETGTPYVAPCCPRCFEPLKDVTRAERQVREREQAEKRARNGNHRLGHGNGDAAADEVSDDEELAVYLTEEELLGQHGPLAKRACVACGEALWQVVPDSATWRATPPPLHGPRAVTSLPLPSATAHPPCITQGSERRYPLADYLRKRYCGLFRSLICDEAHQFKGAGTAQGFAAASLVDACDPGGTTLFLTGTLFSGYCSDLYPMLWRLLPELRQTFGYGDLKRWVDLYGVRQKLVKVREGRREDGTRSKRREDKPLVKELPGISPLVLRHLLDACLFLELADVAPGLPPYSEEAVVVPMGEPLGSTYAAFERETTSALREMLAHYDTSGLAAWFQGLMVQPNLPWRGFTTISSQGEVLGQAEPLPEEMIYPKERALLDLVRRERAEGRRTLIYVEHTGAYDLLPRLKALLEADDTTWRQDWRAQASEVLCDAATVTDVHRVSTTPPTLPQPPSQRVRVALLRSGTVASAQREAWLARTVEEGCDVLLCHSGLVEVGLDLLAFPTIICDEVIFSTTRMRQATRRSYRPGQTQPVRVYQLVYDHAMEARGLALIASKIKSSLMVEGKLPGEGLSSYAADPSQQGGQGDPLLELARSVLADAAGGARDVAGSLEATFRDLATVEQEQDHYIGAVEMPALDAFDTEEEIIPGTVGISSTSTAAHVGQLSQVSPSATTQQPPISSLFSSPWEEWLKAHGTTASPRSRHRRSSQLAGQRSDDHDHDHDMRNLPEGSLWAAMEKAANESSDGERTTTTTDLQPRSRCAEPPSATETPSLWESVE